MDIKIGDIEVEQNFFMQYQRSYSILLRQPYIIATKMKINMLDDGSYYAKIHSYNGKTLVQLFIIRPHNKKHRDQFIKTPMNHKHDHFLNF